MANDTSEEATAGFTQTDPPRDIRVEQEVHDLYKELQANSDSPFEGARFIDIFLTAAAVGSYEGLRQPLEADTTGLFNVSSLSREERTIVRSIAWKETHDDEIYYDQQRAFTIAMEFANGGIHRVHSRRLGLGDTVSETVTDYVGRWQTIENELENRSILEDT